MEISSDILSLTVVLLGILVAPLISSKTRIPVLVVEVIYGIVVGKSFLRLVTDVQWLYFFSFFGLVYLLFLAGLEIEFREIRNRIIPVVAVAAGSLSVPFSLGYFIAGFIRVNPLFLGAILCTTSLGVVLPLAKSLKGYERLVQVLLGSTVLVDLISMFILVFALESFGGSITYSYLLSTFFFLAMFILPVFIGRSGIGPSLWKWSLDKAHFQFEVRFCFGLLAVLVILAEVVGVHAILGAFLAGLIVSELTERGGDLEEKLLGIGYGLFIPFFFILVGVNTDIPYIFGGMGSLLVLILIISIGILSKVIGVGAVARILGFSLRESLSLGFMNSARLSLVLAGIEIGLAVGLIDGPLYSIFVIFSIVSVLIGPSIGVGLLKKKFEIVREVIIPEEFWELEAP